MSLAPHSEIKVRTAPRDPDRHGSGGYDQSPDYGGPEVTWRTLAFGALAFAAAALLFLLSW